LVRDSSQGNFVLMETLYAKIGPKVISELVDRFYSKVFESPVIGGLFTGDRDLIRQKQYFFLTQFFGGPQLYSENFGHPRMRMRHLPHRIDEAAMEEWLRCMKEAISGLDIDESLKIALFGAFPQLARHMVNS
jgi:hemoglobin